MALGKSLHLKKKKTSLLKWMYWTEHSYRHVKLPHSLSMASQMENHMGDPQVRFGAFQTGGGYPQSSSISNDGMFPHQKPSSELGVPPWLQGAPPGRNGERNCHDEKNPHPFFVEVKEHENFGSLLVGISENPMKSSVPFHEKSTILPCDKCPTIFPWKIPLGRHE